MLRKNTRKPKLYTEKSSVALCVCVFMCAFKRNEMWRIHFNLNDVWMMKWTIWFGIWIHLSQHWTATLPYGVRHIFHRFFCLGLVSVEFTFNPGEHKKKHTHPSAICLITNGERRTGKKWISFWFGYFFLTVAKWYIYQRNGQQQQQHHQQNGILYRKCIFECQLWPRNMHRFYTQCKKRRILVNHHWNVSSHTRTDM